MISYLFHVTHNQNNNSNNSNNSSNHDRLIRNYDSISQGEGDSMATCVGVYESTTDDSIATLNTSSMRRRLRINVDDAINVIGTRSSSSTTTTRQQQTQFAFTNGQGRLWTATALLFLVDAMELAVLAHLSQAIDAQIDWYHDEYMYMAGIGGALLGALVWGPLGDVWGRKPVAQTVFCIITMFGMISALCCTTIRTDTLADNTILSDTTQTLVVQGLLWSRALVGFGLGGITVPYDLLAEWLPNHVNNQSNNNNLHRHHHTTRQLSRGQVLLLVHVFWSLGFLCVFALLETDSPLSPHKGQLTGIELWWCTLPALCATLILVVANPTTGEGIWESPRWLLAQGKPQEALKVLRQAAAANGMNPELLFPQESDTLRIVLYSDELSSSSSSSSALPLSSSTPNDRQQKEGEGGRMICSLFSYRWCSLASSLLLTYFGQTFCHRGTATMLVQTFAENQHDQTYQALLSALAEVAGIALLVGMIDSWGRVPSQVVAYALAALACLTLAVWYALPFLENGNVLIALTLVVRMLVFGGGCTTWVSTAEVLKTDIRTTGHTVAAGMLGRLGAFVATVTLPRMEDIPTLALIVFAGCLWITLSAGEIPETRMKEMGKSYTLLGHSERSWHGHRGRNGWRR